MAEPIRWQDRWWHLRPDGSWLLFNEETQEWVPYSGPTQQPVYAPEAGSASTGTKVAIGVGIALAALLILSILAAIAIPVFLRQREKGWIDQAESALKNAAVAQECYFTDNGKYSTSTEPLESDCGLRYSQDVSLSIARVAPNRYCIEARHLQIPVEIWSYDSTFGRPRDGPCR